MGLRRVRWLRSNGGGTWFLDIAVLDDENATKRRKNANATRRVPMHPMLVHLGLIEWRNRLDTAG
jgi:hypothetical protein